MKCSICNHKTPSAWNFCPECGSNLKGITDTFKDANTYLSFRDSNMNIISENFYGLNAFAVIPKIKKQTIRKTIGDNININFLQLQITGLLSYTPNLAEDIFKITRLLGYYSICSHIKNTGGKQFLWFVKKQEKEVWRIPTNRKIIDLMEKIWKNNKIGIIKRVEVVGQSIIYDIEEVSCTTKSLNSKNCTLTASLCGVAEALTGMLWSGKIINCAHRNCETCKVKIYPRDEKFITEKLGKKEVEEEKKNVIHGVVYNEQRWPRKILGEESHIIMPQILNYIILQSTSGHQAIYKYSAIKIGEEIGKEKPAKTLKEAIDVINELFTKLKIGTIKIKEQNQKRTTITLHESALSSGIKKIDKKLDEYPAGIIQGYLNQTQEKKYRVEETKCQAMGYPHCEMSLIVN
jgi:predicted hydrocarbon binding protein